MSEQYHLFAGDYDEDGQREVGSEFVEEWFANHLRLSRRTPEEIEAERQVSIRRGFASGTMANYRKPGDPL